MLLGNLKQKCSWPDLMTFILFVLNNFMKKSVCHAQYLMIRCRTSLDGKPTGHRLV